METINGNTRTVYLPVNEDIAIKIPRKDNEEKGIIANMSEYENTLRFPDFSTKISRYLNGILLIQEKLKLINQHPKLKFYRDLREKCILNPGYLSCNSRIDLGDFDTEEFNRFFQGMIVSYLLQKNGITKEIKKFNSEIRHNMLYDKNYGINNEGKIVLIDLGVKGLDLVLKELGNDIFFTLNTEISSGNKIINA